MNEDQFKGSARNLGGKVEDEFGKLVGDKEIRGEGMIDHVAGTAQNIYGDAKEAVASAFDRASPVVRDGAQRALSMTRENSVLAVLAAGAVGYALAWAFHGDKARPSRR
jgi:uncharacterized protein YjbJ (UPF0337 family)